MSVIGEAALSALFEVLFDKLTSSDLLNIFKEERVDADFQKWKRMLLKIHAVLDDAEEKQVTSRLVEMWLDELRDLAYDVEDILDEFATEALQRELNPEPSTRYGSSSMHVLVRIDVLLCRCGPRWKKSIQGCKKL